MEIKFYQISLKNSSALSDCSIELMACMHFIDNPNKIMGVV